MKNKKGFTLIELLAVIVILAIIALIATPVVLGIIDDARKSAARDSAFGVVSTAKLHFAETLLNTADAPAYDDTEATTGRVFTCDGTACRTTGGTPISLNIDGTVPVGDLTISNAGVVTSTELKFNGTYCYTITNSVVSADTVECTTTP